MSDQQKQNEEKKKSPFTNFSKPKGGGPRFNFNFYWVYALVIFVIIAINFLGVGNQPLEASWNKFSAWVKSGDIDKVVIVNKESVNVFIKKTSLTKEEFKGVARKSFGNGLNEGPHYVFTIGDVSSFKKDLDEVQKDIPEPQRINILYNNNDKSYWDILLGWIFPIFLVVILYMFIIRRMGSGGGGSQIFNIGKSKATLFDKNLHHFNFRFF